MTINLIVDRWLPVRQRSGVRDWIAPANLADAGEGPPVALDFPRPDWNAAVSEMLAGLLAVALRPVKTEDWAERWEAPPALEALAAALHPLAFADRLAGALGKRSQEFARGLVDALVARGLTPEEAIARAGQAVDKTASASSSPARPRPSSSSTSPPRSSPPWRGWRSGSPQTPSSTKRSC